MKPFWLVVLWTVAVIALLVLGTMFGGFLIGVFAGAMVEGFHWIQGIL